MRGKRWRKRVALPACVILSLVAAPSPQTEAPFQQTATGSQVGTFESLEYEVEWRLVNAGRAKLSINTTSADNRTRREMKMHLESTGLVSRLFHVTDDYVANATENYCAESTFMTSHEAGRNRETRVFYDGKARKAYFREHDLTKNTTVNAETETPPCVHDVVSGLFHLRTLPMEPGKSVELPISNGKKSVMLKVECQRREEVRTPLGPRKTLLYEIFAFNNVLYQRPGHIHVWLTDDAQRIPVQIEIRLQFTIGTITLRLDKAA